MNTRRPNVGTAGDVIGRLRTLAAEIDRAVKAAARVRRDIQQKLTEPPRFSPEVVRQE
jgi:hypothetical protein